FFGLVADARGEEGFVDGGVAHGLLFEQREESVEAALGDTGGAERGKVGAAGLDQKGAVGKTRGGVALAEHGELALLASELVRQIEQALVSIRGFRHEKPN